MNMLLQLREWEKTLEQEIDKEKGTRNCWNFSWLDNQQKEKIVCMYGVCACVPWWLNLCREIWKGEKRELYKSVFEYFLGLLLVTALWKPLGFMGLCLLTPTRAVAPGPTATPRPLLLDHLLWWLWCQKGLFNAFWVCHRKKRKRKKKKKRTGPVAPSGGFHHHPSKHQKGRKIYAADFSRLPLKRGLSLVSVQLLYIYWFSSGLCFNVKAMDSAVRQLWRWYPYDNSEHLSKTQNACLCGVTGNSEWQELPSSFSLVSLSCWLQCWKWVILLQTKITL